MTKPQTRELARRFGLSVADKQDSQDICFVPTGRYTDIVGRLKPNALAPGATSMTPATSPSGSASRIMCSTTKAASANL